MIANATTATTATTTATIITATSITFSLPIIYINFRIFFYKKYVTLLYCKP